MKQILSTLIVLTITMHSVLACSCYILTYCDLRDEIVDNERALVFKGSPIQMDSIDEYHYAVEFKINKIYHGAPVTADSPLYNGETFASTDSTVWVLSGSSAACFRYFEDDEAILLLFYPDGQDLYGVTYAPSICLGDYFPIAEDGTVSGNIWSEYQYDVLSLEEFEEVILTNCPPTNTVELSIEDAEIELFPQPATDYLNIRLSAFEQCQISLYDIQGHKIQNVTGTTLDIADLAQGVYFLRFEHKGKSQVKRFVKM